MELGTVFECDIVPLAEVAAAFSGAGRGEVAQTPNEAGSDQRPQSNTPIIDDPEQQKETLLTKIDWSHTSLASTDLEHMKAFIASWHCLFALSDRELSSMEVIEHMINVGSHPPVKQPPRPLPFAMRTVVADMIQDYLDRGVIRPSKSP
uniref:Uncharacterized protein n=1 Tax=Plectus sambesii TaxID=2011161 RepID=A0A914XLH7_9BILA